MEKSNLERYKSKLNQIANTFKEDMEYMTQWPGGEWFAHNNDIPLIHQHIISDKISLESAIILDMIRPYIDQHAEEVKIPFVFPDHIQRLKKYRPFIDKKIDLPLYKDIMKNVIRN